MLWCRCLSSMLSEDAHGVQVCCLKTHTVFKYAVWRLTRCFGLVVTTSDKENDFIRFKEKTRIITKMTTRRSTWVRCRACFGRTESFQQKHKQNRICTWGVVHLMSTLPTFLHHTIFRGKRARNHVQQPKRRWNLHEYQRCHDLRFDSSPVHCSRTSSIIPF